MKLTYGDVEGKKKTDVSRFFVDENDCVNLNRMIIVYDNKYNIVNKYAFKKHDFFCELPNMSEEYRYYNSGKFDSATMIHMSDDVLHAMYKQFGISDNCACDKNILYVEYDGIVLDDASQITKTLSLQESSVYNSHKYNGMFDGEVIACNSVNYIYVDNRLDTIPKIILNVIGAYNTHNLTVIKIGECL